MNIYWRPHHEVHPELEPDADFIAFDEETDESVGRVFRLTGSEQTGRWFWTMFAHSHTGHVPFQTSGAEDKRSDAGNRVLEAYRLLLTHNEQHPRKGKPDIPQSR